MTTREAILSKLSNIERDFSALPDITILERREIARYILNLRDILNIISDRRGKVGPAEYKERSE